MAEGYPKGAIAIVGLAGRFPGARDLDQFWANVRDGVESLETFSEADLDAAQVPAALRTNPHYVKRGTALEEADAFDAGFFGINPREAQVLDPQHRLFLECAYAALESAGITAASRDASVGVFAGAGMNTYLYAHLLRDAELVSAAGGYQIMLGNDKDFLCTRVSYKLDLHGPSLSIQTACSTSLVAIQVACRALQRHECDVALAGGVSIGFPQRAGHLYQEGMIFSPDGHCRPFDVGARGTRAGSGCGVVVLKRLDDALADRDAIRAVIRGSAINNDGAGKAGFTAPGLDGQVEALATALMLAEAPARSIGYVESHGTGTPLGDPIEVAALTQVFRDSTEDVGFCRLGSLKANIGHLDAAAGVASVIKTVLALEHRFIPPLVNFTAPNPQLALASSPFTASSQGTAWQSDAPRRAGVSSFGIGGTNAHVVLEEAPAPPRRAATVAPQLLLLSAKSPAALERMTANLGAHLAANPTLDLCDVAWTLQAGRRVFPHRLAVVARDTAHAVEVLKVPHAAPAFTGQYDGGARPVAFLFSGQGSQHAGMGADLYRREPVFRAAIDCCADLLTPKLGVGFKEVLFASHGEARINETRIAQPALFAMEYALASLWKSWGLEPVAMLGHSIGEYVAAHFSGVLSLEDALSVVAERGRLMQALPAGAMAAVHLPASQLRARRLGGVEIAAINAPALCTISGPPDALAEAIRELRSAGVDTRELQTSHAFHSAMMEPALGAFTAFLQKVTLSAPTIPYVSNVTGTWITAAQAQSPEYYAQHLRSAVNFEAGVRTLASDAATVLLEVGPGNVLATLASMCLDKDAGKRVLPSLAHVQSTRPELESLLESAGRLWVAGAVLDFQAMQGDAAPRKVPLPSYPFERKKYWVGAQGALPGALAAAGDASSSRAAAAVRLYAPAWVRDDAQPRQALAGSWVVLGDSSGAFGEIERAVSSRLEAAGAQVIHASRGAGFERISANGFRLKPGSVADVEQLLRALPAAPAGIVHLLGLDEDSMAGALPYHALAAIGIGVGRACGGAQVQVIHVTCGAQSVLDEPAHSTHAALAIGPVLSLPSEIAGLRMRSVDLEADASGHLAATTAAAAVVHEALSADGVSESAWRRGLRWLRHYQPIGLPPSEDASPPVKQQGFYIITGGLGGMGLALGQWLATDFKARLLLTARSALPPRTEWDSWLAAHDSSERSASAILAIRAMEAAGAEVITAAADAADQSAMSSAIDTARARWGNPNGVIHAAGIAGAGHIAERKTEADIDAVLAPKVTGLDVLVRLLGGTPLDFVALMTSVNAVVGSPGSGDYAAANAVLDAFSISDARPSAWSLVLAVSWGAWRDVGMAARLDVPQALRKQWQAFLAKGIRPAEGVELFAKMLASRRNRIVAVTYDLAPLIEAAREGRLLPAPDVPEGARVEATAEAGGNVRAGSSEEFEAPQSEVERRVAAIWQELLGVERVGLHDDFFELGGHSLLATRVLARVRESLGAALTLRDIFEGPTVRKMTARIEDGVASPADREEIEF